MSSRCWGLQCLDTSTQGEFTKSKAACENVRDFNESERQSQILPLRPESPQQIYAFFAVAHRRDANENRSNNGKNPGNPAQSPGKSPGLRSRVRVAFAAHTARKDNFQNCPTATTRRTGCTRTRYAEGALCFTEVANESPPGDEPSGPNLWRDTPS
jgi:hypothetical protein